MKLNDLIIVLNEDSGKKELRKDIVNFFVKNPYPTDKKIHAFAESIGVDEHMLEKEIYAILSSIFSEGMSSKKKYKYDEKQLAMGKKVEMEHTTCECLAEKIAKDHLAEISDYYTRLHKMEKEAEKG